MKYSIEFIKGLSALVEGKYDKASAHLKNAALEKSDRLEAYYCAGLVFRKTEQFERATYVLESILRSSDIDAATKRALTVELGRVMFEAGNYTIALSLLESASDREGMLLKARALRRLDRYEEAASIYKSVSKSENIHLDNEIGFCYYKCASLASGSRQVKYIKTALKFIPRSRCINMMQIDNMLAIGKSSKALVDIEKFISAGLPASTDDMTKFQSVFFDLNRTEELMRIVMKKIHEGAENPFFYVYAVSRLLLGDNKEKAAELINGYVDKFGFNHSIAKASIELSPNAMLERYLEDADFYKCSGCGTTHKEYRDACPSCQSFETLRPI